MDRANDSQGLAPDRSDTVLIVLDLISDFDFEDGAKIARAALRVAKRIAALRRRANAARIPVMFVNDGIGRWRSDFPGLVRHCGRAGSRGEPIVRTVAPGPSDYCILKPKHSGFFATALETLLELIGAKRLVLTGVSSNQCVLFTANDAYVRDLQLIIPRDCISARDPHDTRLALRYFETALGADTRPSSAVRFERGSKRRT
jgi:nicotinamidase-related amidase